MTKHSTTTHHGTRYSPYQDSQDAPTTSPRPNPLGHLAQTHQYQLNTSVHEFIEDLSTRWGTHGLRELLREHAKRAGAFGQAIDMWLQYDNVSSTTASSRVPRRTLR